MKYWFELYDRNGNRLHLSGKYRFHCDTAECAELCAESFREFTDVAAVRMSPKEGSNQN